MKDCKMTAFEPIKHRENFEELKENWLFSFDGQAWQPICVPYAPQTELSGIGHTDFIPKCFYKKTFTVQDNGLRTILHFGAVDYETKVYINGQFVGEHKGGYTPFSFDITDELVQGENLLELEILDEFKNVPSGKQSRRPNSYGCFYTRVTGIWQPVWLEYRPKEYIENFRFYPNVETCSVRVELSVCGKGQYGAEVFFDGKIVGKAQGETDGKATFEISLSEKHLWSIGKGNLYDVILKFNEDTLHSYFGLREVKFDGLDFFLNGEKVYQKLVLVQGYYADGVYTPKDMQVVQDDIDFAIELGFNGLRLHQKVFDPRYLYLCDKAGLLVWGEFPSWGIDYSNTNSLPEFLRQWQETMDRDFNHPSIITWCPLNEVWVDWDDPTIKPDIKYVDEVYLYTKAQDTTRPCVDVSGGYHGHATDLYDFHCYESADILKKYLDELEQSDILEVSLLLDKENPNRYVAGLPVQISEFGGIAFDSSEETNEESWGYGEGARDEQSFLARYKELVDLIGQSKKISGFCYTQLYDVEQECNGFRTYDRKDKLSREGIAQIKKINDSIEV